MSKQSFEQLTQQFPKRAALLAHAYDPEFDLMQAHNFDNALCEATDERATPQVQKTDLSELYKHYFNQSGIENVLTWIVVAREEKQLLEDTAHRYLNVLLPPDYIAILITQPALEKSFLEVILPSIFEDRTIAGSDEQVIPQGYKNRVYRALFLPSDLAKQAHSDEVIHENVLSHLILASMKLFGKVIDPRVDLENTTRNLILDELILMNMPAIIINNTRDLPALLKIINDSEELQEFFAGPLKNIDIEAVIASAAPKNPPVRLTKGELKARFDATKAIVDAEIAAQKNSFMGFFKPKPEVPDTLLSIATFLQNEANKADDEVLSQDTLNGLSRTIGYWNNGEANKALPEARKAIDECLRKILATPTLQQHLRVKK